MKIKIPAGTEIQGKGKEYPLVVIADLGNDGFAVKSKADPKITYVLPREQVAIAKVYTLTVKEDNK